MSIRLKVDKEKIAAMFYGRAVPSSAHELADEVALLFEKCVEVTHEPDEEVVELTARRMFAAYNDEGPRPWLTYDGKPVPKWNDLGPDTRMKWMAAARAKLTPEV